jgi:glycine/D-amino acid oxidase-like deaminating enzyme
LTQLSKRYGAAASRRIWELSGDAARSLVRTLRRHDVECELAERDTIYFTTDSRRAEALRSELRLRMSAGLAGEWLGPGELRRTTAIAGRGAIRTTGGAELDPYRACLGVLEAASRVGAAIHERSPVRRIEASRKSVRVVTPSGSIDADRVVIATGYATPFLMPLHRRFRMVHTYVIGTRPMSAEERREVGLGDVLLWDMHEPYHYARWTADNRLLLGGADRPMAKGDRRAALFRKATRELREHFERLLPALADIDFEYAWEGLFALTRDSLPYLGTHRSYPKHLFALGYGGNGMTFAALAARILLEQWQGKRTRDHELFGFSRG